MLRHKCTTILHTLRKIGKSRRFFKSRQRLMPSATVSFLFTTKQIMEKKYKNVFLLHSSILKKKVLHFLCYCTFLLFSIPFCYSSIVEKKFFQGSYLCKRLFSSLLFQNLIRFSKQHRVENLTPYLSDTDTFPVVAIKIPRSSF